MKGLLKEWLDFSKDVQPSCAAGSDLLRSLRARTEAAIEAFDTPYFGWCEVDGCQHEGANGGGCWRETGYWTVCSDHSTAHRKGEAQPPMKQAAIDREKSRGSDGILPFDCHEQSMDVVTGGAASS